MSRRLDRRQVIAGLAAFGPAVAARPAAAQRSGSDGGSLSLWEFLDEPMRRDVVAGTLQVDCSSALQRALDVATGRDCTSLQVGRELRIPAGRYLISRPISASFRRDANVVDDRDLRRPVIFGEGQANTELYFRGIGPAPALSVHGNTFERREGTHLYFRLRGIRMQRDLDKPGGIGLDVQAAAYAAVEDVTIAGFQTAFRGRDVLRVWGGDVNFMGGDVGVDLAAIRYSHPNLISFTRCSFGGSRVAGAIIDGGANLSFDSCSFEGLGSGPQSDALRMINGPAEGGSGVRVENCYFENNDVRANVALDWKNGVSGTAALVSNTFQQTDPRRGPRQHILLAADPPARLVALVESCGFKATNGSRLAPTIVMRGNGVALTERANLTG